MRKTKKQIEFCSHTGNLALLRNCVRGFLEKFPFSERQRTLMVLGVDEACTNIIRHAYHLRDDKLISLSLEGKEDCVCLRLRDYGKQTAPAAMQSRPADLIRPGGLGLHLIRNAFDEVDYVLRSRGTELVLTKNLD
jgi:anti-sigma regulatory factor (Ser/Thr protein kinase)